MPPKRTRGRPEGWKPDLEKEIQRAAKELEGPPTKRPRGRPRKNPPPDAPISTQPDNQTQDGRNGRRGRPSNQQRDIDGMKEQPAREPAKRIPDCDINSRTKPYDRDHGRPKQGDFPYECNCGKGGRHWVHSVEEWRRHRELPILTELHAHSIAIQPKSAIPKIYRDRLYPPGEDSNPETPADLDMDNTTDPAPTSNRPKDQSRIQQGGLIGIKHLSIDVQKQVIKERTKIVKGIIDRDKERARELRRGRKAANAATGEGRTKVTRKTIAARGDLYDSDYERREEKRLNRIKALMNTGNAIGDGEQPGEFSTGESSGEETDSDVQINRNDVVRDRKTGGIRSRRKRSDQLSSSATGTGPEPGQGVGGVGGIQIAQQQQQQQTRPAAAAANSADHRRNTQQQQPQPGDNDSDSEEEAINPLDPALDDFDYQNASKQRMSHKTFASLSLLQMQQDGGITTEALSKFTNLVKALTATANGENDPTVYRTTRKTLAARTNIKHIRYDVCMGNCFCYAADPGADSCPHCKLPRSDPSFRERITYDHIPIIPRLRLRYSDPGYAKTIMSYRRSVVEMFERSKDKVTSDFWTGQLHKEQREDRGIFDQDTDMGFSLFTDGVQIFRIRVSFSVWPLILVNLSLPPETRFLEENILLVGIIPGPKGPVNLNSFLIPLYEEFKALQYGVENVYNGFTGEKFVLRAYLCLVCADQKGREKVMGTSGVPTYAYCPYCWAHGYPGPQTTYCPSKAPTDDAKGDPVAPPTTTPDDCHDEDGHPLFYEFDFMTGAKKRTHEDYTNIYDHYARFRDEEFTIKTFGINDYSILHEFISLWSPRSFPIDEMHNLYINNGANHFDLMRGVTFERYGLTGNPNAMPAGADPLNQQEMFGPAPAPEPSPPPSPKAPDNSANSKRTGRSTQLTGNGQGEDSSSEDTDFEYETRASKRQRRNLNANVNGGSTGGGDDGTGQPDTAPPAASKKKRKGKKRIDRKLPKFIDSTENFGLSVKSWWAISFDMDRTREVGGIPTAFGYNIRSIARFCHKFKAEEWKTWFLRYAPIYLRDRLPTRDYLRNMDFTRILQLCSKHYLSPEEIEEIAECIERFIEYYDNDIYKQRFSRVVVWKSSLHHLGHIVENIKDCGPMYGFACWVIERVNGMIARGARSKKDTNRNLSINALQREQFNHLKYTFSEESFIRDGDSNDSDDDNAAFPPVDPARHFGFDIAEERSCVFASFRLYLDTLHEDKALKAMREEEEQSQTESQNEAESSDIERRKVYDSQARKRTRQVFMAGSADRKAERMERRDNGMMKNRGRGLHMARAFEAVSSPDSPKKFATVSGSGKVASMSNELKLALIKDGGDVWASVRDWSSLRIRVHATCRISSKGVNSASEFTVSASAMRKRGVNRSSSLCQVRDIDAEIPEPDPEDPDNEPEVPLAVAQIHTIFTVERKPIRKRRGFVNPNLVQDPADVDSIDSETIFAMVYYYPVTPDRSFLHIPEKPKATPGVITASDIDELIGFVVDRKQRVLVNKFGPIYENGEFDPLQFY